jgi:heterodisulfide reductase subunit A
METKKVGVYVCNCGTNIAKMVDCDAVAEYAKTLPGVVVCKSYKYMCSNPGQEMIVKDIQEFGLDRVVVAACSPRMHEPTFRAAIEKGGLNPTSSRWPTCASSAAGCMRTVRRRPTRRRR